MKDMRSNIITDGPLKNKWWQTGYAKINLQGMLLFFQKKIIIVYITQNNLKINRSNTYLDWKLKALLSYCSEIILV